MTQSRAKNLPPLKGFGAGNMAELYEEMAQDPFAERPDLLRFRAQLVRYGARVRQARKALGWTQKKLSQETGLSQPRISAIESGTMDEGPTFRTMHRLSVALSAPDLQAFETPKHPKMLVEKSFLGAPLTEVKAVFVKVREMIQNQPTPAAPVVVARLAEKGGFEVMRASDSAGTVNPDELVHLNGFVSFVGGEPGGVAALNETPNYLVVQDDGQFDGGLPSCVVHLVKP